MLKLVSAGPIALLLHMPPELTEKLSSKHKNKFAEFNKLCAQTFTRKSFVSSKIKILLIQSTLDFMKIAVL
jgi:hypothetical protein